jgi:hypothetical protein
MQWLDRFKDLLAIVIATIAVILSLVTVMAQRRQQRREAYRQIQDVLMSPELQRGRWMITEISRGKRGLPDRASPEFYLLNRTLGVFDTLAMYVRRGVVPREWVLDMWHHSLADMRAGARQLARRHQETNLGWTPWPELWSLLDESARYRSSLVCCASPPQLMHDSDEQPPPAPAKQAKPAKPAKNVEDRR